MRDDTLTPMAALPTYLRIAETLSIDIGAGRLAEGDRLPPERQFAAEHGVSVTTLRKALKLLEDRRLIARRHGSGNYVTGAEDRVSTYALFRLERVDTGGGFPTADLISFRKTSKPDSLPSLGSPATEAWNIRRLRHLDGLAVAVEDIWLDGRFGPDLRAEHLSQSLYRSYRDRLGLTILRAEDRISLGPCPDWAPSDLMRADHTQMGLVERTAFDEYGTVAEISTTWFDPSRARYVARSS
ncbi:MAG: GntR family transcriptional regulator [Pseudomonadota bacterium]